jgi:hypothetical protein
VRNQNIFISFSEPRWALKNRTKKLRERERRRKKKKKGNRNGEQRTCEELMRRKIWVKRKRD